MKKFITHFAFSTLSGLLLGFLIIIFFPTRLGLSESPLSDLSNRVGRFLKVGQTSYSYAVKRAAPAVVNIATTTAVKSSRKPSERNPFTENSQGKAKVETSLGSGVIISSDGFLLTNNHVIEGADNVVAALRDGREARASLVGRDPDTDLAVLKIDLKDLPSLKLADSGHADIGDVVLAIGNPFGLGQTVTQGIISATGRNDISLNTYEDFIQTDAAINVGNSGGALVNAYGDLIGINTLLFSSGGGNDGVGFAIPSSMARFVTTSIIKYGRVIRGWLGIESQPLSSQLAEAYNVNSNAGILITGVFAGGPADRAGLRRGDILTSINNISTSDGKKVMNMVAQEPPGSEVTMTVLRDNQSIKVKATVTTRPNIVNQ